MKKYDVIIGLGQNIRLGSSRSYIENSQDHLSYFGKEVATACGLLFSKNIAKYIIYSGGFTTKYSESEWMRNYTLQIFPKIKPSSIILENISWDTTTNAIEVKKILKKRGFKKNAIVSTSFHKSRALYFFKRYGIEVSDSDFYSSGEIVSNMSDEQRKMVKERYSSVPVLIERFFKEPLLNFDRLIDKEGKLPRLISSKSRKA